MNWPEIKVQDVCDPYITWNKGKKNIKKGAE